MIKNILLSLATIIVFAMFGACICGYFFAKNITTNKMMKINNNYYECVEIDVD